MKTASDGARTGGHRSEDLHQGPRRQRRVHRRKIQVQDQTIRYLKAGSGPPLLWLPSRFLGAESYRAPVQTLASHFQVLAPDLPGSGHSRGGLRHWTLKHLAEWSRLFLDELGIERAVVLGHSDTGGIAIRLAAGIPDRLLGLILVDSAGDRPRTGGLTLLRRRLHDAMVEEFRLSWRLLPSLMANLARHPNHVLDDLLWRVSDTEPSRLATRVEVPTLIAWGRHDHTFPSASAERLHAAIAGSALHWVDGSHDWVLSAPDRLTELAQRFATEHGLFRLRAAIGTHGSAA